MKRRTVIVAATLASLAVVAAGALAARDAVHRDRPLPGVTVREVALDEPIEVRVGAARHGLRPRTVLRVDEAATAARARERGRDSFLTRLRALADPSPPELAVDPVLVREGGLAAFVERAERRLRKPVPARVSLAGVQPSRPGDEIDREAFFGVLEDALLRGRDSLRAPLRRVQPERTTAAAEEALETARALVAAPVELAYRGRRIGSLAPRRLARLVRFVPRRDHFVVTFDKERLAAAVRPALRPWRKRATNARFLVANGGVRIRPSRPG
ncbi:MAG TPA: hypothetical protein VFY02_00940, partial [Gaiellaceae bacterium]|nr:hypothetical protein [Gaiellaceae bacterium]